MNIASRLSSRTLIWTALLLIAFPIVAQDGGDDSPLFGNINYDTPVEETITDEAPFDRWDLSATEGSIIVIEMEASGGLAPLFAVLDSGSNALFFSDTLPDGTTIAPEVDGVAELEFQAPYSGTYTIVATREGREAGTTTGAYTLLVRRAGGGDPGDREALQEVVFRCGADEATTATTILFTGEGSGSLRISVYGLDGFEPVVRLQVVTDETISNCGESDEAVIGDTVTLPDGTTHTVAQIDEVSRTGVTSENLSVFFVFTIGSRDRAPGRYIALIEGFRIEPATEEDEITFRLGPLATETALDVYMVGPGRLDPFIFVLPFDDPDADPFRCDDASLRECERIASVDGAGIDFADESQRDVFGDRFDAGARLQPGSQDPVDLILTSREGITAGAYALLVIGELPARDEDASDDDSGGE